ncbi:MAG: prepilin-type N-terminal cleavage/methylation domain-containing protein [Candidatus Gracilibacteria bacterium]|nr:prepilin-type N-terminal cleavage/methylation domain-containing protein [Candidatus Gracilibacteria bacterium]MDD2908154.1 prepilin-type N-terminal cleavage/methylation domain-containing protein [Candidatus Gracilibacteria bacterium]
MKIKTQAFTMIELIIVIVILSILSTIAMVSYIDQELYTRDAKRSMDSQLLVNQLTTSIKTNGIAPQPAKSIILYSNTGTNIFGYQGYLDSGIKDSIGVKGGGSDPLGFDYTYMKDVTGKKFELLIYYENQEGSTTTTYNNPFSINTIYAAPQYSMFFPHTYGDKIGITYQTSTKIPLQEVGQFSTTGFDIMSGSLLATYTVTSSYENCPTGWIGVPGSSDFNTSSFCVMKYEAKALSGAINSGFNGHIYSTGDIITSNTTDVPIVTISQSQAIAACQSIGAHLITNNEWMTIARNLEQNPSNWSTGLVGSGYIYNGHVNSNPATALSASTDTDGLYGMTGGFSGTSYGNNRRTLYLTNGNIIWDFAGNAREHVNKANTYDTANIDSATIAPEMACSNGTWAWYSWYGNDTNAECIFQNGYSRTLYGPQGMFNANNGVGRIYATNIDDRNNIFIRGGTWGETTSAGIFSLGLNWTSAEMSYTIGFRCAK